MSERRNRLIRYAILIGVYGFVVFIHDKGACPYAPDSLWYADITKNILKGNGLTCNISLASDFSPVPSQFYGWPPLYPLMGVVPALFGLTPLHALRLISIISFILLPIPLVRLGSRIWGNTAAFIATATLPFLPTLFSLSSTALSESMFLLLLFMAVDQSIENRSRSRRPIAAGVFLGLASLTRMAGGIFMAGLALIYILLPNKDGRTRRQSVLFALGIALLIAAPWVVRNSLVTGGPSGWEEPMVEEGLFPIITASLQRGLWEVWSFGAIGLIFAKNWKPVLLVIGIIAWIAGIQKNRSTIILLAWAAGYLVVIAWMRTQGPFDSPSGGRTLVPTLMLVTFAIVGGAGASVREFPSRFRRGAAMLFVIFIPLFIILGRFTDITELKRSHDGDSRACPIVDCSNPAIDLLHELLDDRETVLSMLAFKTAYCLDAPSIQLPIMPYSSLELSPAMLAALSRFHNARFLYLEKPPSRAERNFPPLVLRLLNGKRIPGVEPICEGPDGFLFELRY